MKSFLKITLVALTACHGVLAEGFPTPPQQNEKWTMPESMDDPDDMIGKVVRELFKAGMADPRGLPYHHVTVREGTDLLDARGWVLPAHNGQGHAIGWSGLIYPLEKVGKPADLEADLKILERKGRLTKDRFYRALDDSLHDVIGKFKGDARMIQSFAAPYLLMRLGHPVMLAAEDADPFAGQSLEDHEWHIAYYPHEALAEFAAFTRDDGVAAWVDGDYPLAVERLRKFDALWNHAEAHWQNAEKLLSVQQEDAGEIADPFAAAFIVDGNGKHFPAPSALPELNDAWREVLVDAKRRLSPGPPVHNSEIAQAIASWDQIEEWSEKNPPASYRLVTGSGLMAIKPLLECLEHDERWTRVIHQDEENPWESKLIRVRDVAILALNETLQFYFDYIPGNYRPAESDEYDELAKKYRSLCEQYGYQVGPELWYRILKDPTSSLDHQRVAAKLMVTPFAELSNPYYHLFEPKWSESCCEYSELTKPGETLRFRSEPTVIELMTRVWERERERVEQLQKNGEPMNSFPVICGHGPPHHLHSDVHDMIHYMEDWQPGNLDVLRAHYQWLHDDLKTARMKDNGSEYYLLNMCEETLIRRHWANDLTASEDYELLFRDSISNKHLPVEFLAVDTPSSTLEKIIESAFLDENAPLNFVHIAWEIYDPREDCIAWDSPFLKLPAFRKALIEGLQCTKVQATLTSTPEETQLLYHASEERGAENLYYSAGIHSGQTAESTIEVRVCDLIAFHLTPGVDDYNGYLPELKDVRWLAPDFHLNDPIEQRDKAITTWIERLKNYH